MLNSNYYTYRHIRPDTGEVFYIGKGTNMRAWRPYPRSKFWKSIVSKNGGIFTVEIITHNLLSIDAELHERYLISLYGRRDLGNGSLCNLTDGGDGSPGKITSDETKKKMSLMRKGKPCTYIANDETRRKMSIARKGKKQTKETVMKRAKSNSKPVLDTKTNNIYNSILIAARENNISHGNLCEKLKGIKKNNTSFIYYKPELI